MKNKLDLKKAIKKHLDEYEKNKDKYAEERLAEAKENPNCLNFWYPKIKDIDGVKTPETHIIPFHYNDLLNSIDQIYTDGFNESLKKVEAAADIVGYPCFMKNSLFSGKHSWKHTCFVDRKAFIRGHLRNLTDECYCVGAGDSLFIIIRKMLITTVAFHAYLGMPVTKERRYFIENGKVTFHHPYWPPHSVDKPDCEDWEDKLQNLNYESDEEIEILTKLSEKVSNNIEGAWSVDWLQAEDDNWYLIDMALEQSSFKWSEYKRG